MERIVTSDKIVTVETIVREHDRVVSFDDILESVSIEYDDWNNEPPWENSDGWEHETRQLGYHDHDGLRESRGYARTRWNEPNVLIEIDDSTIKERWGCDAYPGASKQVRFEAIAAAKRKALDQLVKWYEYGWEYYFIQGEYEGYGDSVGGVDSYEYAEELRLEIAHEIANQMEADDYIVEDRPTQSSYTAVDHYRAKKSYYPGESGWPL